MYTVDKVLLQLLKHRSQYDKLRSCVQMRLLDGNIKRVVKGLDTYFNEYPTHDVIIPDTLLAHIGITNADLGADDMAFYSGVVDNMMLEPDQESVTGIVRSLKTLEFSDELDKAVTAFNVGGDVDLFEVVSNLSRVYENDVKRGSTIEYCQQDIGEILEDEANGTVLRWGIDQLHGSMPGTKTGQQIIFAARPGRGKTSFCAFNAKGFAQGLPDGVPIAWFNNEGKGREIWNTLHRTVLAKSNAEITAMGYKEASAEFQRVLGSKDRVRIFDIHGRNYQFVNRVIQNHAPRVVFFDMLDNIQGFGDAARTDLRLEELYKWARESAVINDFLSIPTSQLSVEAENVMFPGQSMLKDSKTAKQGACDAIITMGAKNKPELLYNRYLYVPKAFKGTPLKGYREDCLAEVMFDSSRCQFTQM